MKSVCSFCFLVIFSTFSLPTAGKAEVKAEVKAEISKKGTTFADGTCVDNIQQVKKQHATSFETAPAKTKEHNTKTDEWTWISTIVALITPIVSYFIIIQKYGIFSKVIACFQVHFRWRYLC